jgi:hypothetical protein
MVFVNQARLQRCIVFVLIQFYKLMLRTLVPTLARTFLDLSIKLIDLIDLIIKNPKGQPQGIAPT